MIRDDDKYPIERYIMEKNDCCRANRRRKPTGIQVHSVGCKGTTRERWRCWNTPGLKKCANAFVDLNGIMQTLDWDVRPWLSGSGSKGNANDTCVGFEICEPSTAHDTPEAAAYLYGCVLYLCTELCREFGIHPRNIKCHSELHKEGRASNHADVNHWWGKAGTSWENYTMARLRHDAAEALGVDLTEGTDMINIILKKGMQGDAVMQLQAMLNTWISTYDAPYKLDYLTADGVYGSKTLAAVVAFQEAQGLTVDGIAGPKTLERLQQITSAPDADARLDEEPEEQETAKDPEAEDPAPESDKVLIDREELYAALKIVRELSGRLEAWIE